MEQRFGAFAPSSGSAEKSPVPRPHPMLLPMLVGHLALAAAVGLAAGLSPAPAWAYAALLIFASFCLSLLKTSPATFLLFAPLLALRLTEFISGAAIESGAYLSETAAYGEATGAFTRLLLIYLLFFGLAALVTEALWPRIAKVFVDAPERWAQHARRLWWSLLACMGAATAYLVWLGMAEGFPLFSAIDRFEYRSAVDSPLYDLILNNRVVIAPFVGVLFAVPGYRLKGLLLLAWLLGGSVAFAEKFTSLLMILSMFAIPAGLVHVARSRPIPIKAVAAVAAAVVAVSVPSILAVYGGAADLDKAATKFGDRIALQGQLWYRVDDEYLGRSSMDAQAFAADVASWFRPGEQKATIAGTRFGLYYVMEKFTPSHRLHAVMETGNGFIFSLYPYLFLALGGAGMLAISSLLAAGQAWVVVLLAEGLARPSWLASLLFARVMSSLYATFNTGFLWNAFGIKTLLTLTAGVLLLVWQKRRNGCEGRVGTYRWQSTVGIKGVAAVR